MKDLGIRVASAIIGVLLLVFIINKGGFYMSTSIFALSIIGLREFYKALHSLDKRPIEIVGYLGTLGLYTSTFFSDITLDLILTSIILILLLVILFSKNNTLEEISLTLLGFVYIPFLLFHISYLDGTKYIWLIFIIAFGTDTFAYIVGNLFGKNKLCPNISPNKTVEGFIGGIAGSIILTIVFSLLFNLDPIWKLIILSFITSIISQLGDLVASRVKRLAKIKDYGFIMPGHGGVLDRFDSIILTAPVIYYFVKYFLN